MRRWGKLFLVIVLSIAIIGCSNNGATIVNEEAKEDEKNEQTTDTNESVVPTRNTTFTVGNSEGTHLEVWSFIELHTAFYASMVEKWNEKYPDKQIEVTFKSYKVDEVYKNLATTFDIGVGTPDICDVEIGYFPQLLNEHENDLYSLNEAIEMYKGRLLQNRLDVYSRNGNYYGVPTHVGATVMYYNTKILESYGIDYTTIETWQDYTEVGKKLYEASNGEVSMTAVDTGTTDWEYIALAQHQICWIDKDTNTIDVEKDALKKMLIMQQNWLESGVAVLTDGGNIDSDEGMKMLTTGKIASFPKSLWFMSRFINYMPQMEDVWAIVPCPVFEKGQNRSVGLGGTGTIVTKQSKNAELAAEFITYAKCSRQGSILLWEQLGFDVCNTSIWKDKKITNDKNNEYISYFLTNPFDVLNDIEFEIRTITITDKTASITENMLNSTLSRILKNRENVDEVLHEAQKELQGD